MLLANFFFKFHALVQKCHFGKIAKMALLNLCMKFKIFLAQKHSFEALWKWQQEKNIHNLSKGPSNPGFMQEKVQKRDFLKKDSRELNFFSCFRFLWISQRPGTLNWERVVVLPSKNLYRKCVQDHAPSDMIWTYSLWGCNKL